MEHLHNATDTPLTSRDDELGCPNHAPENEIEPITREFLRSVTRPEGDNVEPKTNYEILGVNKSATINEIRIAYHKLIKKYHPDKNVCLNPDVVNEINRAYGVLKDPIKRSAYDQTLNYRRTSEPDFVDMRRAAKEFLARTDIHTPSDGLVDEETIKIRTELAKKKFDEEIKLLNMKNRYTTEQTKSLTQQDFDHRFENLNLAREQEDIETLPDKNPMAEADVFDQKRFNEEFEAKLLKKQEIIQYDEVSPFNTINVSLISEIGTIDTGMDGSCLDSQFDTLTDASGQQISNIISMQPSKQFDDTPLDFEAILKQRELETEQLKYVTIKSASRYIAANGANTNVSSML
jgi:hypothetical protein